MTQVWTKTPRVVVGYDGSSAARWALAWAVGESRLRDLPLLVVHVIRPDHAAARVSCTPGIPAVDDVGRLQRECSVALAKLLAEVTGPYGPEVTATCPYGHPGVILTDLTHDGDLLVIGQGRHGLLARLVGGSTQSYCARHARATLVVVPVPAFAPVSTPADAMAATPPSRGRARRSPRRSGP